jgi:tetratricopeptide (TPR) repeat protein
MWWKNLVVRTIPILVCFVLVAHPLVAFEFRIPDIAGFFQAPERYFLVGEKEERKLLQAYFHRLETTDSHEGRFILIQQIMKIHLSTGYSNKLNLFLTTYVEGHLDDPFNGYYLSVVAQNYIREGAYPFAIHYFERILKNYPDLSIQGNSIHYMCLSNLIHLVEEPEIRVDYYKELIARFHDDIDISQIYYSLAKTYEDLGEWELAIQAYKNFLAFPDAVIPGVPNAHAEVSDMIGFYDMRDKNWTMEDLDELVRYIAGAIWRKNVNSLNRYRAKVNFFACSWEQTQLEVDPEFISNLSTFLQGRVWISDTLDRDSNLQEAYIETGGWSYRIKTWYLYFRKVNFPADPEIHGEWEWAGIYFGEKPFSGSEQN